MKNDPSNLQERLKNKPYSGFPQIRNPLYKKQTMNKT